MWLLERGPKVATSDCSPLGLPMLLYQQDMGLGQRPGPAQALADTPVCPAGRMSHFPFCSGAVGTVPPCLQPATPVRQHPLYSPPLWEDPGDTGWEGRGEQPRGHRIWDTSQGTQQSPVGSCGSWQSPWHILGHTLGVKTHPGSHPSTHPGACGTSWEHTQGCTVQPRHILTHIPGVRGTSQGTRHVTGGTAGDRVHP